MKHLLVAAVVGALLWAGYHYLRTERQAAFDQGYATAQALGDAAVQALHREYATAQAEQAARAHQQLQQAVAVSHAAERQYLQRQRDLANENQHLQEQLNAALIDQPDCHFTAGWVQHYSAALGLPGADQTPGGARGADAAASPAASPATLLQHAQQYGYWCRSNTQKLTALQQLIRSQQ